MQVYDTANRAGQRDDMVTTPAGETGYRVVLRFWEPRPGNDGWLIPGRRGAVPGPAVVFDPPLSCQFRIGLTFSVKNLDVLRLRCRSRGPAGSRWRDIFVDVTKPGALLHDLDRVVLEATDERDIRLELEAALDPGETLHAVALDPSDDWFNEAKAAPGMALRLDTIDLLPVNAESRRPRVPFAAAREVGVPPPEKRKSGRRDAVVFAWWIPDTVEARAVGEYYLGLLRYHHPDSRIFLGVNHGSHPEPVDAVRGSGLDVEICPVPADIEVNSDAAGFLAALEGFHRSAEQFDLVWFGHTKGASRASDPLYYRHVRFVLERRFWARRAEIERVFADPRIGLFAPQYNLLPTFPWPGPWRGWLDDLAALQRIYRSRYPPLGLNALDTFYVLRGDIVRAFCDAVSPWFFRTDPADYGASRWLFEMAIPSIATMQGFEPYIDMDVPGANDPRDDIMLDRDMRQVHRLAQEELQRWREDPFAFVPRVLPWDRPVWQEHA